jgi:hypothetical protein
MDNTISMGDDKQALAIYINPGKPTTLVKSGHKKTPGRQATRGSETF